MNATTRGHPRPSPPRQPVRISHVTSIAALERLSGSEPESRNHACFTAAEVSRLAAHPERLGDAVLATDGEDPLALSWSVRADGRQAEQLFAAPLRADGLGAASEAIAELARSAGRRGTTLFFCRVPLEAGWLGEAFHAAGLHVDSQEYVGGASEVCLSFQGTG